MNSRRVSVWGTLGVVFTAAFTLWVRYSACVMTIEGLEDDLSGVRRVTADYRRQKLSVEYDERNVTHEAIVAAVRGLGYQAIPWS